MRLASSIRLAIYSVVLLSVSIVQASSPLIEILQPDMGFGKDEPIVWVFEPFTSHSEKELQASLSSTFPGVEISIFTRFRDFREALSKDLPDAVVTRPLVLDAFPELPLVVQLRGSQSGSATEFFAILAHKSLEGKKSLVLGAVDIKGRRQTSAWLERVLPQKKIRLKAVSKMEDLMSLLLFDYVDAIVVPLRDVAWFQSKTEKALFIQKKQFLVRLPVIATMPRSDSNLILEALKNYESFGGQGLGVERWLTGQRTEVD